MEKELASIESEEEGGEEAEEEGEAEEDEDDDDDDDEEEGEEEADTTDEEIKYRYDEAKDLRKRLGEKTPGVVLAFIKAYKGKDPGALMDTFRAVEEYVQQAEKAQKAKEPEVAERSVPRTRTAGGKEVRRAGQAPSPRPVAQGVAGGEQRKETPKFEGELSRAGERLAGYAQYRSRVRVRTKLPEALGRETEGDILLYALTDGTTQVWINGAQTESFDPSRGRASWKTAALYAKKWLETPGATGVPKKSHLGMRVVISTQDEPEKFEVVQVARSGAGAPAPKKLESLSSIAAQLREDAKSRSNPRSCREGYLRNPLGRQVVADVQEVFRRSNPGGLSQGQTIKVGFRTYTVVRILPNEIIVSTDSGDGPQMYRVEETTKAGLLRSLGERFGSRSNPGGLSEGQTVKVGFRTYTVVRILPNEIIVSTDSGDGPQMYRVEETTKAGLLRSLGERFGSRSNPALPNKEMKEMLDFLEQVTRETREATAAIGKARTLSTLRDAAGDAFDAAIEAERAAEFAHESARLTWRKDPPEATVAVARAVRAAMAAAAEARAAVKVADSRAEKGERLHDDKTRSSRANPRKLPVPEHITKTPRSNPKREPGDNAQARAAYKKAIAEWLKSPYSPLTEDGYRKRLRDLEEGNTKQYIQWLRRRRSPGPVSSIQPEGFSRTYLSNPSGRFAVITYPMSDYLDYVSGFSESPGYPRTLYFNTLADVLTYVRDFTRNTTIARITQGGEDMDLDKVQNMVWPRVGGF